MKAPLFRLSYSAVFPTSRVGRAGKSPDQLVVSSDVTACPEGLEPSTDGFGDRYSSN